MECSETKVLIVYADQWDAPAMLLLLLEQSGVSQFVSQNNLHTLLDSLIHVVWLLSVSRERPTSLGIQDSWPEDG